MVLDPAPDRRIFVAGTFNDWSPADDAWEMLFEENQVWESRLLLDVGGHAFKFTVDGLWDVNWGEDTLGSVIPPLEGKLQQDGANILLNIQIPGLYLFRVDLRQNTWAVFPRQVGPGPGGVLAPRSNVTWFEDLLRALEQNPAPVTWENWVKSRLVPGDFNGQLPLLEGNRTIFSMVSSDEETPIYVAGTFNDWSEQTHLMTSLPGTPLQFLDVELPPATHHEYKFYSQGRWFPDPFNRLVTWDRMPRDAVGDFNSVLPGPGYGPRQKPHLLWLKRFYSLFLDNERDVFVLFPPGYSSERERYPVLYVNDGNESITRAHLHEVAFDLMQRGEMEKIILVFVALPSQDVRGFEYTEPDGRHRYAHFLTRELVPFVDSHFHTRTRAKSRGIIGSSQGGANAIHVGWHHPHVFGKAGAQGGSFHIRDYELVRMLREGEVKPLTVYLDSSVPLPGVRWGDNSASSQMMARVLQERGYRFLHNETHGEKHDWLFWKDRFAAALKFFWPEPRCAEEFAPSPVTPHELPGGRGGERKRGRLSAGDDNWEA